MGKAVAGVLGDSLPSALRFAAAVCVMGDEEWYGAANVAAPEGGTG